MADACREECHTFYCTHAALDQAKLIHRAEAQQQQPEIGWGENELGKDIGELSGVTLIFCILRGILLPAASFVQMHHVLHSGFAHFITRKFYLKRKNHDQMLNSS